MDDAGLVGCSKRCEDLARDTYRFFLRQSTPCDNLRQRLSANHSVAMNDLPSDSPTSNIVTMFV